MTAHRPLPRLSIVTLGVADLARSRAFYEGLGFEPSAMSQDTISFYRMAGTVFAIYDRASLAEDASVAAEGSGFSGVTLAMCLDGEADVDETWRRWVDGGAVAVKPPQRAEWGGYSSYVADPDGHLWEIAFNPYIELQPDGSFRPDH